MTDIKEEKKKQQPNMLIYMLYIITVIVMDDISFYANYIHSLMHIVCGPMPKQSVP